MRARRRPAHRYPIGVPQPFSSRTAEWGETADGTPFPDGDISQGLFCNVFEFRGELIDAVRIYVDPDFTNKDTALIAALR